MGCSYWRLLDPKPDSILDSASCSSPSKAKLVLSHVDRSRIIKAHLSGKKPKMISEIMDIPKPRIELIIRNYAKTGRIGGPSTSKKTIPPDTITPSSATVTSTKSSRITTAQIKMLRIWANEDASQTGAQLATRLNDLFGTKFSVPVVQRQLGDFTFSLNRISSVPAVKNDTRTLTLRKEFCQIYQELSTMFADTEVVYVGHVRFRLAIRDRTDKDEKARGRLRQRNMSVCVAMTKQEVIGYQGQNTAVEREEFQQFVESVIETQKQIKGVTSGVLIMDEDCIKGDSDALSEAVLAKDYTAIFLPPNSPFLNPLEVLFGEFRKLFALAKLEPTNESTLVELITGGSGLRGAMDCSRYVDSVKGYVPSCIDLQVIEVNDLHSIYAAACEGEEDMEQGQEEAGVE